MSILRGSSGWAERDILTTAGGRGSRGIGLALLLLALIAVSAHPLHALTPPGTVVTNTASVSYDDVTGHSNAVEFVVGFLDVPLDYWAHNEIMACLLASVVEGYPDGNYHPDFSVSRDQMAVFISRIVAGGDENVPEGPGDASFPNVSTEYWAYKYIEYAKDRQIILGYPDGLYHPDYTVNRGQMAVFIARSIVDPTGDEGLAEYTPPATPTSPDVTQEGEWSWCHKYVEYIAHQGIISGYPDGTYDPGRTCSRDQMAVFFARAFELRR